MSLHLQSMDWNYTTKEVPYRIQSINLKLLSVEKVNYFHLVWQTYDTHKNIVCVILLTKH